MQYLIYVSHYIIVMICKVTSIILSNHFFLFSNEFSDIGWFVLAKSLRQMVF